MTKTLPETVPRAERAGGLPPLYGEVLYAMNQVMDLDRLAQLDQGYTPADIVRGDLFYDPEGVRLTPLQPAHSNWEHLLRFDKLETEQPVGAFKIRGAFAAGEAIRRLSGSVRRFVAYSAGNHALGLSHFVRVYNRRHPNDPVDVDLFLPDGASKDKRQRISEYGPYGVVMHSGGPDLATAEQIAQAYISDLNSPGNSMALEVTPYSDPFVVAGQSTAVLEVVWQLRTQYGITNERPLHIRGGYGGGGLARGGAMMLAVLKEMGLVHRDSKFIASQMEQCDNAVRGLAWLDDMCRTYGTKRDGLPRLPKRVKFPDDLFADTPFDPSADGTAVRRTNLADLLLTRYLRDQGHLEIETVSKKSVAKVMRNHPARPEPAGSLGAAGDDEYESRHYAEWLANGTDPDDHAIVVRIISGANRSDETIEHFEDSLPLSAGSLAVLSAAHVRPPAPRAGRRPMGTKPSLRGAKNGQNR